MTLPYLLGKLKKIGIVFSVIFILFIVMGLLSATIPNNSSYQTTDNLIEETTSSENLLEESIEKDFVEEYWEQHPDEDPCNDPTAKAFGLCP